MNLSAVGSAARAPTAPPLIIPSQIQNYVAGLCLATSWAPKPLEEAWLNPPHIAWLVSEYLFISCKFARCGPLPGSPQLYKQRHKSCRASQELV